MDDEDKLIRMYEVVHGEISTRTGCSLEVDRDEDGDASGVVLMKDGNPCWRLSKTELLFDYITKDWD